MRYLVLKTHAMDFGHGLYKAGHEYPMPNDQHTRFKLKEGFIKEVKAVIETKEEKFQKETKRLFNLKVSDLVEIAKERGIKLTSRKKEDIIKRLLT